MTDLEKNKIGVYESVISVLAENKDIVSTIKQFSYTITKLRRLIDEVNKLDKVISSQVLEKTIISSNAKEELIVALCKVSSALYNYARDNGDIELKAKTRISHSNFIRLRDSELLDKSELIQLLAKKYAPKLKKYGLFAADTEDLKSKIGNYRVALSNKVTGLLSSDSVMAMGNLFNNADQLVKQMDVYAEALSDEYLEFYEDYIFARDIENQDQVKAMMEMEMEEEEE